MESLNFDRGCYRTCLTLCRVAMESASVNLFGQHVRLTSNLLWSGVTGDSLISSLLAVIASGSPSV